MQYLNAINETFISSVEWIWWKLACEIPQHPIYVEIAKKAFCGKRWLFLTRWLTDVCKSQAQRQEIAGELECHYLQKSKDGTIPEYVMDVFLECVYPFYDANCLYIILRNAISNGKRNHVMRFLRDDKVINTLKSDVSIKYSIPNIFQLLSQHDDYEMIEALMSSSFASYMYANPDLNAYVLVNYSGERMCKVMLRHKVPLDENFLFHLVKETIDNVDYVPKLITTMIANDYTLSKEMMDIIPKSIWNLINIELDKLPEIAYHPKNIALLKRIDHPINQCNVMMDILIPYLCNDLKPKSAIVKKQFLGLTNSYISV
jgi:hypothetical protein